MIHNDYSGSMSNCCSQGATREFSTASKRKAQPSRIGGQKRELLAAERLEAASRLTAWVAHEINNPLGAIFGNAQLLARCLQRDIADPKILGEYMRFLDGIRDQAERCARITAEMQRFTQQGEPDLRPVDIPAAIFDAIDVVRYAFPECRVTCETSFNPELPRVKADPEWFSRIMFELLSNAVEASGNRPVIVRVSRTKEKAGAPSNIEIEIEDSGSGINEAVVNRVFDPFFSTREKAKGLGLTLSLEMARKMSGSLQIAKSDKSGSIFVVSIPVWGNAN